MSCTCPKQKKEKKQSLWPKNNKIQNLDKINFYFLALNLKSSSPVFAFMTWRLLCRLETGFTQEKSIWAFLVPRGMQERK